MIKRMLDTNICIYIAKRHPADLISKLAQYRRGELAVSSVTWGEFSCGISRDGKGAINRLLELLDVIPFCREAAEVYALLTIRHPNRRAGFDRLIAAHAIALDATLISNNTANFAPFESSGLRLENWINSFH